MMRNSLVNFARKMLVTGVAIRVEMRIVIVMVMTMVGFRVGIVVMQWSSLNGRKLPNCNILMYGI
jgi:hypothetical protein